MISVTVETSSNHIVSIYVSGHSESEERGRDLICAAVSGITFGLCNAVDELIEKNEISVSANKIKIVISEPDFNSDLIMKTGVIQLKTVEESNKEFISIKTMEV